MPAKLTATRLKAIIKGLPGKLLLECNLAGNLDLYLKDPGYVYVGKIDFGTGQLSVIRCPTCGLDLEDRGDGVKLKCPSCKNIYS